MGLRRVYRAEAECQLRLDGSRLLAPPWGAIYCHQDAHIAVDECGAPEFYTGGAKLVSLPGELGRLSPVRLGEALARSGKGSDLHEAIGQRRDTRQPLEEI